MFHLYSFFLFLNHFYCATHFSLLLSLPPLSLPPLSLSPLSLPPLSLPPLSLPLFSHDHILSFSLFYLSPCMFLSGSSLLSRSSGVVNCRAGFSLLYVKKPLISEYILYLYFWVWVTLFDKMFFRSILLPTNFKVSLLLKQNTLSGIQRKNINRNIKYFK